MKKLIIFFSISILAINTSAQNKLPDCEGWDETTWTNCIGKKVYSWGTTFVGEYQAGKAEGYGKLIRPDGSTLREGYWKNGAPTSLAEFEKGDNKNIKIQKLLQEFQNFSWMERVSKISENLIKSWLEEGLDSQFKEIPAPIFPPALKIAQEKWESNKEFEDRINSARIERQNEIERIQADYKIKVEKRNDELKKFTLQRLEKEKKLPEKKIEVINEILSRINLKLTPKGADFNSESGILYLDVSIEGAKPERFEFKNSPIELRRQAITSIGDLKASPVFFVSGAGQFGVKGIAIQSNGVVASGTPTKADPVSQTLRVATIDVPVVPILAVAQQSGSLVDKNQVEQILYRDENESLKRRLEEQRKAQELALSEQAKKVDQETAKFKAEAEAAKRRQQELEQQLAQSTGTKPVRNYARSLNAHALVIGNSAYSGSARLANPQNDAKSVSAKLRELGFRVTDVFDADRTKLVTTLSSFASTAQAADLTMLFYAGHGVQISGTNYMLPVDLNMNDLSQVPLQGVSLSAVIEQYLPGKTKLVFLDACRDNPLMQTANRGLGRMDAPRGTLLVYSTAPGKVASDGPKGQRNSPFTKNLLRSMQMPNLPVEQVLKEVRRQVLSDTQGEQVPWENSSLIGDFVFRRVN